MRALLLHLTSYCGDGVDTVRQAVVSRSGSLDTTAPWRSVVRSCRAVVGASDVIAKEFGTEVS